ncbi:hypothetical protein [Actinomadura harenae]|uniref:Uncharacterized protein n=1 Tax=Actinomadura harenae TaxID=2483351 RepID=A0A3M2MAB5_9ACTN|nr:hypothetical protein [Actinomadura harenae]RMI46547.1 hypothetical protein EBO15_06315 [Actinomadura harenae]
MREGGDNTFTGDAQKVIQIGTFNEARPDWDTPWQAPGPADLFVDRSDALEELLDFASDATAQPRTAVVTGPPGVGRRALVRRFAFRTRDRFPGGNLYVDAADHGADADPFVLLGEYLTGYGLTSRWMPSTIPGRVGQLRTRSAGRATLAIVENAADPALVRRLKPSAPGSLVLVTPAPGADLGELRLDGARSVDLGRLADEDALDLLTALCGLAPDGPPATRIVALCGGLPLALRVVAAQIAALHDRTVDDLVAELADEGRRLPALSLGEEPLVSAAFTTVYDNLPDPVRLLYRRLALIPGPDFAAGTAAVAASLDVDAARRGLTALAAASLLERRAGGRYAFHDLVRVHARERAHEEETPEQRETAVHELVRHHLATAAFADHVLMGTRTRVADLRDLLASRADPFRADGPKEDDPKEAKRKALAWLDAERAGLVAVVGAARERGWHTETWQLAEVLTGYYLNHRHLADWAATSGLGARSARESGAVLAEARLRSLVSRAHTDLGDHARAAEELDTAIRLADQALRDAEGHPGSADSARARILLASAWEFRGRLLDLTDPQAALDAYDRSYALNREAGEWRGVALVRYFRGRTLHALADGKSTVESDGLRRQAAGELDAALAHFRSIGDTRMASRVLIALGGLHADGGDAATAIGLLEEAAAALDGVHYEAEARLLLAGLADDPDAAREHLRRALAIYRDAGDPRADDIARRLTEG